MTVPEKEDAKEKAAEVHKALATAIPAILSGVNAIVTSALSMDNRIPCMHRIFQVLLKYYEWLIPDDIIRCCVAILNLRKLTNGNEQLNLS